MNTPPFSEHAVVTTHAYQIKQVHDVIQLELHHLLQKTSCSEHSYILQYQCLRFPMLNMVLMIM